MVTGGGGEVDTAGSADAVLATGGGAVVPLGGVHPGGGTKALSGSPERAGAAATVMICGAGATGSAVVTAVGADWGAGVDIGAGEADVTTVGAGWPGGAHPGGGTNALLGSAARAGTASATIGAGDGTGVATIGVGAGGSAIVVTTGAGVVTGAADAMLGAAGWPGGAQPGGGINALLGSAGGAGGAGGATGSGTIAGAGAVAGGVAAGSATGALVIGATGTGAGPGGGSAATGGVPLGASAGALLLASFSAAARAWRCSRALASRSSASFSMASFWAFWPPLPATMEPICGPVRVSSTGAIPASYWRPEFAEGRLELAATDASAPGRAFALGAGALPPNIPQPDRSANADTPTRPYHRPRPPIVCCSLCIVVTCLKPDSLIVFSGSREEI